MDIVVRTPAAIGAALRRQRKKMRLSQSELGERINLRQATISALEAGTADAKLSTLTDVLAALGLELVVRSRSTAGDTCIETVL